MEALRRTFKVLLDETKPLTMRLDKAVDAINGLGKGILTAILHVAFPEKYGVWNRTSEVALTSLEIWPSFDRGTSFGKKHTVANDLLARLAKDLQIDLWTLDALLWRAVASEGYSSTEQGLESPQMFALERHLHEFLRDNWESTTLGKEWAIYEEEGDPDRGYEFPCGVRRIDLLAKHKRQPRWMVVELKRHQSDDQTVGQILKYIGWIQEHLATENEKVEGLIISQEADGGLRCALKTVPNVRMARYEVDFHLTFLPGLTKKGD
ncbi:MAG: DUF1016 family protein [Candidatus Hydrogenedentes bacterium]|nr:DUF1016 family protein [Candidatus Hydrogenedentota bacterium]